MTPGQILAAILLAMAISAAGTWQVQDWRLGEVLAEQSTQFETDLTSIGNAAAAEARAEQEKRLHGAASGRRRPKTYQGII